MHQLRKRPWEQWGQERTSPAGQQRTPRTRLPQVMATAMGSSAFTVVSTPVAVGGSSQTCSPGTLSRSHPWTPAYDMHMATEGRTRSWWTCRYWLGWQPGAPVSQMHPHEPAGCAAASLSSPLGTQEAPSSGPLRSRGPPRTPGCFWA